MRLRMIGSEAVRSITANLSTTIAATVTVLIGMFLVGLLIAFGTWARSWSDHTKDQLVGEGLLLHRVDLRPRPRRTSRSTPSASSSSRIRR